MSLIVTSDLIELTKIGLEEIFLNEINAPNQYYPDIFEVEDMDKPLEEYLRMAGFGAVPEWNADGGEVNYDKPISSGRIGFTAKDYALAWVLSHKILRDDLYKKTSADLTQAAGLSVRHTTEQFAANVIANGFTVNGPDGVPLFSANHPLLGGGVQSNLLANAALSDSALTTAIGVVRRAKNDRNQPIVYGFDSLVIPPELEFVAAKLMNNSTHAEVTQNVAGNQNVASAPIENVLKGVIPRYIVWPYLVDASDYFLLASKPQRKLKYFWRERPWYDADKDFKTKGVANSVAYACTAGYISYQGIWGATVT